MLQLRWPSNPLAVESGEVLELWLLLENAGEEPVEFADAGLMVFGRLFDHDGNQVRTPDFHIAQAMPRIEYVIEPGAAKRVRAFLYLLAPEDQRALAPGRYTFLILWGLEGAGAERPEALNVEIRPARCA
jgi:hypothetical protein